MRMANPSSKPLNFYSVNKVKVILLGKDGQLGQELQHWRPPEVDLLSYGRTELDICDRKSVEDVLAKELPAVVINAAAYTQVDRAEQETANATMVNADAPLNLAQACSKYQCKLIHVSTDFVFDGRQSKPYQTDSETNPLSVYGKTKLQGEKYIQSVKGLNYCIIRTSWVYSAYKANFVKTMLKLMSEKDQLTIVADQIGSPTWAAGLARFIWHSIHEPNLTNITHWTDAGIASWYDFAIAIQELALEKDMLEKQIPILPISSDEYPTAANRPAYPVLGRPQSEKNNRVHWRKHLSAMLDELKTITHNSHA